MPWDEDSLSLEGVLSLDDGFCEHLAVVGDGSKHVVDQEWLSEVVLVVRVGHGFEVQGHGGSALNIAEFVHTSGGAAVGPNTGTFWAWLGGATTSEIGSVSQSVTIPSGSNSLSI